MICIADATADIGRYVVINNMMMLFPSHEVAYLKAANFKAMAVPKEWLYLLAHGSPETVGHIKPDRLAHKLLKRGLQTGTRIEVRACHSGVPSALTHKTYVDALVQQISAQSQGKVVVYAQGYTGTGVVQSDGTYLAKDEIKNDPLKKTAYKQILDSVDAQSEIAKAELFIQNALQSQMSLKDIARGVAQLTQKTFALLYKHNLTVTKLPEPSLASSSLEAYLSALDPSWLQPGKDGWTLDILEGVRWQAVYEWSQTVPPSSDVYRTLSGASQLH